MTYDLTKSITLSGEETESELNKLKREIYKQSRNDGTISGLALVAREMGRDLSAYYGPKYLFSLGAAEIYLDDYGNYMTVRLGGKLVVSTHNEQLFAPGLWLKDFLPLIKEAKCKHDERERARQLTARNSLAASLIV